MIVLDWFVDEDGRCQPRPSAREWDLVRDRYYFHQFLTEILEIVDHAPHESEEWNYLPQIRRQVRQLLVNSYWVKTRCMQPGPVSGTSVTTLYNEIGYPLTVQNVATNPGTLTSIHNHGTWGVVFQIRGEEHHKFWQRVSAPEERLRIELVSERLLGPGEILSFHPNAIHQVKTVGGEPSLSFQLYGDTQPKGRFKFEPETQTTRPY